MKTKWTNVPCQPHIGYNPARKIRVSFTKHPPPRTMIWINPNTVVYEAIGLSSLSLILRLQAPLSMVKRLRLRRQTKSSMPHEANSLGDDGCQCLRTSESITVHQQLRRATLPMASPESLHEGAQLGSFLIFKHSDARVWEVINDQIQTFPLSASSWYCAHGS